MDPISIAASAITLIQAAGAAKTGLQRLAHALKTADSRITELCNELANLTAFLEAVERTLKECRPLDCAYLDQDLWHQSELCIADCHVTLNELAVLVDKIKKNTKVRTFGWRVRTAVDLTVYAPEIATFRDKIQKSNWALQTLLHTVNVSLSLRNNSSQERILFELDRLKSSIEEALLASVRPSQGLSHGPSSDARVARNLRSLAEAAKEFHSAASSTASTIRDSSGSSVGNFPAYRRERVESYIRSAREHRAGHQTPASADAVVASRSPSPTVPTVHRPPSAIMSVCPDPPRGAGTSTTSPPWSAQEDADNDEDDEAEFQELFLSGLEDLAKDSIRRTEFEKAIGLLTEAVRQREKTGPGMHHVQRLQTQIALCHLFRNDWKKAEPIVSDLAATVESFSYLRPVLWTMLHAVALGYLSTYRFDDALSTCKKAIKTQKKWMKANHTAAHPAVDCAETTGLLATVYEMQGDYIAAEIYRRRLPEEFEYHHYSNPCDFISNKRDVLGELLGADVPRFNKRPYLSNMSKHSGFYETRAIPGRLSNEAQSPGQDHSNLHRTNTVGGGDVLTSPLLRASRYQWERAEMDTTKEVVTPTSEEGDADDEASTVQSSPSDSTHTTGIGNSLARRATRIFGSRRRQRQAGVEHGAETDSESSLTESPIRRWFKGRSKSNAKRHRTVLRKRANHLELNLASDSDSKPSNSEESFRVLHVRRFSLSRPANQPPKITAVVSRGDHTVPELSGKPISGAPFAPGCIATVGRAPAHPVAYDSVLHRDSFHHDAHGGIRAPQPTFRAPVERSAEAMGLSELPADSFSGPVRQGGRDQAELLKFLQRYSLIPPQQTLVSRFERDQMSHLALPWNSWNGNYFGLTEHEARAYLCELGGRNGPQEAAQPNDTSEKTADIQDTAAGALHHVARDTANRPPDSGNRPSATPPTHGNDAPQHGSYRREITVTPPSKPAMTTTTTMTTTTAAAAAVAAIPEKLGTTLSWLSGVLASLPAMRRHGTAEELGATRLDLEALAAGLDAWSADPVLCRDVRAIIASLPLPPSRAGSLSRCPSCLHATATTATATTTTNTNNGNSIQDPHDGPANDSGYDTMGDSPESGDGDQAPQLPKIIVEGGDDDAADRSASKTTEEDHARRAELRRMYSWARGDEAGFSRTSTPCRNASSSDVQRTSSVRAQESRVGRPSEEAG